jgi:hypothetical protein
VVAKLYYGDVGTVLKVQTGVDMTVLTDATCILLVKRPGETDPVIWDATISSLADEKEIGLVRYIFDGTNDLIGAGTYVLQALVYEGDANDNKWYGQTTSFTVHELWT